MPDSSRATAAADETYLEPAACIDSDHPDVIAFARARAGDGDDKARAIRLYYAVRDDFRYAPYSVELTPEGMKASAVLKRGDGFCITKATLLAAACRAVGIPARLGFADVRNHLATERMRREMDTDLFIYHGFTEILLNGEWVKATPAFNLSLCEKFGVLPLEFDGEHDSVFHPFDAAGQRHMEYVRDHGSFADVPLDVIVEAFVTAYPRMYSRYGKPKLDGDMEAEAAAESTNRH